MKVEQRVKIKEGALFIMPRNSSAWRGAEALWITVAGWSAAAEKYYGNAWVVATDCIATPSEASHFPKVPGVINQAKVRQAGKWLPSVIITLLKDFALWRSRNRKTYSENSVPWTDTNVKFVWEQHDLFHGPGRNIARSLGVPFILYVHAPIVWEASRWGVKRPIWGKLLEYFFESRSMKNADLVACVSDEVSKKIQSMGIPSSKIIVSPMSVDADRFTVVKGDKSIRQKFGLENKVVIGWTGSFRGFHGLDGLVRSFQKVVLSRPDARLVLVGDGAEREAIERLVDYLQLRNAVIFSGRVPFEEIPFYVASFDVAIVSASSADNFHYSPLKLREYLAAECAVLAPRAGEIPKLFEDEKELVLYTVGSEAELSDKILRLINDPLLRRSIAEAGCKRVLETGTWDYELKKVLIQFKMLNQ